MKNLFVFSIFIVFIITSNIFSQDLKPYTQQKEIAEKYLSERGEVYFKFYSNSKDQINQLTKIISIDNVIDRVIYYEVLAYANKNEMLEFAKKKIIFEVIDPFKNLEGFQMSSDIMQIMEWDTYPTYQGYLDMMNNFQVLYPDICQLINFGTTVESRQLLTVKISDSVSVRKDKPQFFYSSSAHGNELTGYVLMLRLIDTLCKGYGSDPKITYLLKNCEIWINPLANPDGAYHGGNHTISGAIRYNANGIDLNRNFPDPAEGLYPTGPWQPETIAMMNIADENNFVMSGTFHGGIELISYPWGTWSRLPGDDDWFIYTIKRYVDTVHSINPSYMISNGGYPNIPGITNSNSWYRIVGGKKDYIDYYVGGREVSIELSNIKTPPGSSLPNYWNYNYKSFLNYVQETLYGIRGIITDSITGLPLKAKIQVSGKEIRDSTWVKSDSLIGDYHRLVYAGTYTLKFSAPNYHKRAITNVYVQNDSATIVNVKLSPIATQIGHKTLTPASYELYQNYPNPFNPVTTIRFDLPILSQTKLIVYNILGEEVSTLIDKKIRAGSYEVEWDGSSYPSGVYFYKLTAKEFSDIKKMVYIK